MGKVSGLVRKKSAYYYVRRIPHEIRHLFGGRQQIVIALRTTDYRIAVERARSEGERISRQFGQAKLGISPASLTSLRSATDRSELYQVARLHLYDLEISNTSIESTPELLDSLEESLAYLSSTHEEQWAPSIQATVSSLIQRHDLSLRQGESLWFELVELVRRAEIEHCQREIDRIGSARYGTVHDRLFEGVHHSAPVPALEAEKAIAVSELVERFKNDPTRAHLSVSANKKYIIPFAALQSVVGPDRKVRDIKRRDCSEVHELIASLPSNYNKYPQYKEKSLKEIALLAQAAEARLLSSGSVEVYVHHLSAFFKYARTKGYIDNNPAEGLLSNRPRSFSSRKPFSIEQLNQIITHLPRWDEHRRAGRFWVPMIGLFSGMRLGEIVWLSVDDIKTVDGVTVFSLEENQERSLKTSGSVRRVPVHPELQRLGFLEFATQGKIRGGRLFPDLPGRDQRHGVDLFQKRFSYFLRENVKLTPGLSFHSFRHGFRDAMTNAGLPTDAIKALGGWGRSNNIEDRYGQGARPSTLDMWMKRMTLEVSFPGLQIDRLMTD
ncbi:tyrosine-type recombinase/integrase [Phyllobacterium sp. SYP-B3895]|uniref:site-specific integrase n=1 Tax=Phyllobacterium sp. SYP-B3895 TaxID=2663240 RepID=UPI001299EA0D|nr:site-specific integrase [Phyllobacterium sp. SYP-B3895]MRG56763.1 tyrosine-type recombinase/integrase [Phyllobacterium sp. SYP-B3895]